MEFPYIISELNNLGLSEEELKNLSYQERGGNLLNNNPVFVATHFHYKSEIFFKEVLLTGTLGKTKYHSLRIEFQEQGSAHVR